MSGFKFLYALILCSIVFTNCRKEKPTEQKTVTANYEDSLKNTLWAYYNFNNSSFNDVSGNSRHMNGVNGAGFTYDMWGNNGNALGFDGINDYSVIDAGKNFPEGDFTISFLMMPTSNTGRIFQKANFNNGLGASFGFGFDQDLNSNGLHYYIGNDPNICTKETGLQNSTLFPINKTIYTYAWYMVVLQHKNGIGKVYINGNLVASGPTPNASFKNCTTAPFYLGMWWLQHPRHYAGKIDELRIYNRALSKNEVKYLYDRLP